MTDSSSSRSVASRRRYLAGVCGGVRRRYVSRVSCLVPLNAGSCLCRRCSLQRCQPCGICAGASAFVRVASCGGLYIGSYWCLCLSACTPLVKRARHSRLATREHVATPGGNMRCELCICSHLHLARVKPTCLSRSVSASVCVCNVCRECECLRRVSRAKSPLWRCIVRCYHELMCSGCAVWRVACAGGAHREA